MQITHSLSAVSLLLLISLASSLIVYWLFKRLKTGAIPGSYDPVVKDLGGFSYGRLALISALSLFMEMMMVRWVSSEIGIFAYLKNFVLIACFLGFGLGCYLCRRRVELIAMIAPLLFLGLLLKTPIGLLRSTMRALPQLLGGAVDVHIWGVLATRTSWMGMALAVLFVVPLFALIATIFVPYGQLIGWYLENARRGVVGYSYNVIASLVGIGAYTLLCFLNQPPWVWFLVAGVLSVLMFWRAAVLRKIVGASFVVLVLLVAAPDSRVAKTYWSPYQKLVLQPVHHGNEIEAYRLTTNGAIYQVIWNLSDSFVKSHPEMFRGHPVEWNSYNMPYHFYPSPDSVLVLGAGMGNDVAAALRNGAQRVVAVEIDPLILRLGRELHFEHPYQSSRAEVVINDARSYIENSHDHFNLIVFSLLDSHTTTSQFTNIRIDNYVYTREALRRAKSLLGPDGLFIVKFQVDNPWIAGRLLGLMRDAFDNEPIQFQDDGGRFFIEGTRERLMKATADPVLGAYLSTHSNISMENAILTTDDWPYFYQRERGLPTIVVLISVAVLIVFGYFLRQTSGGGPIEPHFILLGAGFMLLEAQIVSKMALLFGTTWVVNSIVVSALLCLIVAANAVYGQFPRFPMSIAYCGLFVSLLVMLALPMEKLFFESQVERIITATLALCTPAFFAGLIFISSFARVRFRGSALGSNLFGSLLGGLLESTSMWFGLKSLTMIAIFLYIGAAIFMRRSAHPEQAPSITISAPKGEPAVSLTPS